MRRIVAVIALMAALGACEANAEIEVREDGSGTFGFSFVIEDQFLQLLEGFGEGGDPFDEFRKSLADSPIKFDVREFPVTGGRGIRATAQFKTVAQLKQLVEDAENAEPSPDNPFAGGPGFGSFTLEQRSGGWFFESISEAPDLSDLGGLGGSPDSPIDAKQLASLLKITFRVTLPGTSVRTTADDVKPAGGKTSFTWNADLASEEPMELVAQTKSSSSLPLVPIAALVVALGIGMFGVMRMRRKSAVTTAAEGADQAPGDQALGPPPGDGPGSDPAPPPMS